MVIRSDVDRNPSPRASSAEVATFAVAMVSNAFFIASISSTDSPRASGRIDAALSTARSRVQRYSAPPAERESEGRDHHRLGRKFDGLRHALKLTDGEVHVVPLFFLDGHEQEHQVGAYGKILRVVGNDEGVEGVARSARLQRLEDQ